MSGKDYSMENIKNIKIELLDDFKNHPFESYDDSAITALAASIKTIGLQNPVIVRKIPDSERYEIIAGHNRVRAHRLLKQKSIPAIVKDVDNAEATLIMAETNLRQRERMKFSEKVKAYALEAEALTSQGKLTGTTKRAELSKLFGESGKQVERYLHLSKLSEPFLSMLDRKELSQKEGLTLAKLAADEQNEAYETMRQKEKKKNTAGNLNYIVPKIADINKQKALFAEYIDSHIAEISRYKFMEALTKYQPLVFVTVYYSGRNEEYGNLYNWLASEDMASMTIYSATKNVIVDYNYIETKENRLIFSFFGSIKAFQGVNIVEEAITSRFQQSMVTIGFSDIIVESELFNPKGTHFIVGKRYFEMGNFIGIQAASKELFNLIRNLF